MTARDYTDFDKKLLAHIEAGTSTMTALSSTLEVDAKPFASKPGEESHGAVRNG